MVFIYGILSVLFIMFSFFIFKKKINPVSIYSVVWLSIVVLYEMKLIQYEEISFKTWSVIFLFHIVFFLGNFIGVMIVREKVKRKANICIAKKCDLEKARKIYQVIVVTTIISAVAILPNIISIIKIYGIGNLIESISIIYNERVSSTSSATYIGYFGPFIFIALIYMSLYIKRYGVKKFFVIPIILALFNAISFGGRNNIMLAVFCVIVPAIIDNDKSVNKEIKSGKYILIFSIIFLVLFIQINNQRATATTVSPYISSSMEKIVEKNHGFYKIYSYTTSPLGVLNKYLEEPFYKFGANTFLPIYKQLVKFGLRIDLLWSLPFYNIPISSNVGTYIMEIIIDFGIIGGVVLIFIIAMIIGYLYMKIKYKDDLCSYLCLTIILFCITMSFFMWYVRSINIWIVIFFGAIAGKIIDRSSKGELYG